MPYLAGIEFRFFDDPGALAQAYSAGAIDAASGLTPATTSQLASEPDSHALHYPGSTLTAVLLNLRPGHPEFADPAVRAALLAAIDRPTMVRGAFSMAAGLATSPIPPSSPLFDRAAGSPVPYDPVAAAAALKAAGWSLASDGWHLPKVKTPIDIELISPSRASNSTAFDAAEAVAHDWKAIGIGVHHIALAPGEFANDRLATGKFSAAVGDMTIGLDPDLYPLLASSQTVRGASNIIGLAGSDARRTAGRGSEARLDGRPRGRLRGPPAAARQGRLSPPVGLRRRVRRGPRHRPGTVGPGSRGPG